MRKMREKVEFYITKEFVFIPIASDTDVNTALGHVILYRNHEVESNELVWDDVCNTSFVYWSDVANLLKF